MVQLVARSAGSARGLVGRSLGIAAVVVACGGESHSVRNDDGVPNAGTSGSLALGGSSSGTAGASLGGAGGAGSSGGGSGGSGAPDVPRLDGVPTGDCREPSDDERTALGCPASLPDDGASCDLARGVTCSYSLSTDHGTAYQQLFLCSNDQERRWWSLHERCGELCSDGGPHALELDATDCMSRPLDDCELVGAVFAYAPSGNTLLSYTLSDVIQVCAPGTVNFSVALELAQGCPTRFTTNYVFSEEALACIREKLESARYACGELLPCVDYSVYLL